MKCSYRRGDLVDFYDEAAGRWFEGVFDKMQWVQGAMLLDFEPRGYSYVVYKVRKPNTFHANLKPEYVRWRLNPKVD